MMLEAFISLLTGLIDFILNLIPTFDLGLNFSVLDPIKILFKYINLFVSVQMIIAMLTFNLIRDNYTIIKNIFFALLRKVPGLS